MNRSGPALQAGQVIVSGGIESFDSYALYFIIDWSSQGAYLLSLVMNRACPMRHKDTLNMVFCQY